MSTFENDDYQWRETYFVFFDESRRPSLEKIEEALSLSNGRCELRNQRADEQGQVISLSIVCPDDFSAIDVSYLSGEEVIEQANLLYDEFSAAAEGDPETAERLQRLLKVNARFDVLHFEQMGDRFGLEGDPDEDMEVMLDPAALLGALEALVELTGGIGVDPASGELY